MVTSFEGYVSPSEGARIIGIAPVTLRLWVKTGKIAALRTPNGMILSRADVERAARERKHQEV